jgi:predicted NUDIX family NTP pyrophosphohydrolase
MIALVRSSGSSNNNGKKGKSSFRVSSGAIVWRHSKGKLQILLVHQVNKPKTLWSIPKGGVKADEDHEKAARREVLEETNVPLNHMDFLGYIDYGKTSKRVYCYMAQCPDLSNDVKSQEKDVDKAGFFEVGTAKKMVDKHQRKLINALQKIIAFGMRGKKLA